MDGTRCWETDTGPAWSEGLNQRPGGAPSHPSYTVVVHLTPLANGNLGGRSRFSTYQLKCGGMNPAAVFEPSPRHMVNVYFSALSGTVWFLCQLPC